MPIATQVVSGREELEPKPHVNMLVVCCTWLSTEPDNYSLGTVISACLQKIISSGLIDILYLIESKALTCSTLLLEGICHYLWTAQDSLESVDYFTSPVLNQQPFHIVLPSVECAIPSPLQRCWLSSSLLSHKITRFTLHRLLDFFPCSKSQFWR